MKSAVAILLSGLAAQQVSATWSRNAPNFNSPNYSNCQCSNQQKSGYSWGNVPTGPISSYDGFTFGGGQGGWTCANSFGGGKRDLNRRFADSKCIKNTVSKSQPAQMSCQKSGGFSVKTIDVSVEFDCNLEFHYTMPDKSICKQTSPCKASGTTVENTQCGGASSVQVYLGDHNQPGKDSCSIGFHNIGWDCSPGQPSYTPSPQPKYTPPATSSKVEKSTPVYSVGKSTPPAEKSSIVYSVGKSSTPAVSTPAEKSSTIVYSVGKSSAPASSAPAQSTMVYHNSTAVGSIPIYTPSSVPVGKSSTPVASYTPSSAPAEKSSTPVVSTPGYTPSSPAEKSSTPVVSTPGYTPSAGSSAPGAPSSSPAIYSASTPMAASSSPAPPASSSPAPGYTPPECLPKCMNTWMSIKTQCKDNTDVDCYCKNADFTKSVIDCVVAWSTDDAATQEALKYLIGICAAYVPGNPGLITNCPSKVIGPTPTPSGAPPAGSSAPAVSSAPGAAPPASSAPAVSSAPGAAPPASSAPGYSAPAVSTPAAVSSAPGAPPAAGTPPAGPVTAIPYTTTVVVPCSTVPAGTIMTTITSSITVPVVHFTTQPPAPGATGYPTQPVALVPGTPAPAPAQTTGAPYPVPSGFYTAPVGTGTAAPSKTAAPSQFTGAASVNGVTFGAPALLGAALAFFAL